MNSAFQNTVKQPMKNGSCELTHAGSTATLTMTRASCLDSHGKEDLLAALEPLRSEGSTRSLIIRAQESHAWGVDVSEIADMSSANAKLFSQIGHRLAGEIAALPIPVIAAVEDAALGGGCELVLACDIAIAGDKASFGQIEAMGGVMPGFGGTWRLSRRVGFQRASAMMFTAAVIDAATAFEYGLVLEVTPAGSALERAQALADLIAKTSAKSVACIKAAMRVGWGNVGTTVDAFEEEHFPILFGPEQSKRMRVFLADQGRAPVAPR